MTIDKDFFDDAARALGHGTDHDPAPADADPDEVDELEATDDAATDDDEEAADGESKATDAELAAAFWEGGYLSPDERRRAETDELYAAEKWGEFLDQVAEGENEADADGDDAGDEDSPTSGLEVVQMALHRNASELVDEDGEPVDPAAWLAWAVDADPRAWQRACRAAGWSTSTPQPSHGDLRAMGRGVQGSVLAESWENLKADRVEKGRYLGR